MTEPVQMKPADRYVEMDRQIAALQKTREELLAPAVAERDAKVAEATAEFAETEKLLAGPLNEEIAALEKAKGELKDAMLASESSRIGDSGVVIFEVELNPRTAWERIVKKNKTPQEIIEANTKYSPTFKAKIAERTPENIELALETPAFSPGGPSLRGPVDLSFLAGKPLVILDTETTGRSARDDRIIEICLQPGHLVRSDAGDWTFSQTGNPCTLRFNPGDRVSSPEALAKHGIQHADLASCPKFEEHAPEISKMLDGAVLVAHNLKGYDFHILHAEMQRAGQKPLANDLLDTLPLTKRTYAGEKSAKLEDLLARTGVNQDDHGKAHSASGDVFALAAALPKLVATAEKCIGQAGAVGLIKPSPLANMADAGRDLGPSLKALDRRVQPAPEQPAPILVQSSPEPVVEDSKKAERPMLHPPRLPRPLPPSAIRR